MHAAWRASGKVAVLGYNYIQNPAMRLIRKLIGGRDRHVNHVRMEMDEDFMADAQAPFAIRNEASAGYGALDDFAVHPLSLLRFVFGGVARGVRRDVRPYADALMAGAGAAPSRITTLPRRCCASTAAPPACSPSTAPPGAARAASSCRSSARAAPSSSIRSVSTRCSFSSAKAPEETQGFRTILSAPVHKPYDRFIPAAGHSLGFNDLKVIECRELIGRIRGEKASNLRLRRWHSHRRHSSTPSPTALPRAVGWVN